MPAPHTKQPGAESRRSVFPHKGRLSPGGILLSRAQALPKAHTLKKKIAVKQAALPRLISKSKRITPPPTMPKRSTSRIIPQAPKKVSKSVFRRRLRQSQGKAETPDRKAVSGLIFPEGHHQAHMLRHAEHGPSLSEVLRAVYPRCNSSMPAISRPIPAKAQGLRRCLKKSQPPSEVPRMPKLPHMA